MFKKIETIVIYCGPLVNGKRKKDLDLILNACLSQVKIEKKFVIQTVSDGEGAVRNAMKACFPRVPHEMCLAHQLQTVLKHALALGASEYKSSRLAFKTGFDFWTRIRTYVGLFTKSKVLQSCRTGRTEVSHSSFISRQRLILLMV